VQANGERRVVSEMAVLWLLAVVTVKLCPACLDMDYVKSLYSLTRPGVSYIASCLLQVSANKPAYSVGASTQLSFAADIASNGRSGALSETQQCLPVCVNGACVPVTKDHSLTDSHTVWSLPLYDPMATIWSGQLC